MDGMTVIAVASIVTSGLTIGIGCMAPALGEGRSVATALSALAQQPDASATITRTLFVGLAMIESTAIYCFVVSMILIFANPFWNHVIAQAAGSNGMLVDWFTVAAQALNFLILVWLMKRFLYKPILQALEVREKRIATELADATAMKADATNVRDELQHRNDEFDHQRADLVKRATDEANADGQRLRDEACRIAAALRTARADGLRTDAQNLNQAIGRRTEQEVFAIARKALTDLASVSLEERVTDVFIRRVRAMDGTAKDRLAGALKAGPDPTIIRSAFELPPAQRAAVQQLLDETFSGDVHLRFETAPELVSGIELTTNGQQVGWSIADYLSTLEQEVGALLETQGTFGPASADPPGPEPALHAA